MSAYSNTGHCVRLNGEQQFDRYGEDVDESGDEYGYDNEVEGYYEDEEDYADDDYDDHQVEVNLDELDNYMEKLYEVDIGDKKEGTFLIMQLARNPENLEALVTNEPLLGALSRVLKDDGKNSMDLVINILYVFYSFSHFSQFHRVITTYNVGSIVLKTIEYEDRRFEELKRKLGSPECSQRDAKKIRIIFQKQEKLLYVCFHILLNLAEDVKVELKMKKRNIIPSLIRALERDNDDLRILVVTFLKKLSIFRENKDEMIECGVVDFLQQLVKSNNETLLNITLRLMFNLSFDREVLALFTKMMPRFLMLLREPLHMEIVIKILYHMSTDDKCRSMFHTSDYNPLGDIVLLIINYPEPRVEQHLMALAINLCVDEKNAELMVSIDGAVQQLITRMFNDSQDNLLAKLLRGISDHEKLRPLFRKHVPDLISLMVTSTSPEFLVEILGIVGNFTYRDVSFLRMFEKFNLVDFFQEHLSHGVSEDDIVLGVVIALGTLVNDEETASMVAQSMLIGGLCDLFVEKQEDDEFVLQILYTMFRMLVFKSTRTVVLEHRQIVNSIVELLHDENQAIQAMADRLLDLVMDSDEEWREHIKKRRFQLHNEKWLEIVDDDGVELDDGMRIAMEVMDNVGRTYESDDESVYFYSDLQ